MLKNLAPHLLRGNHGERVAAKFLTTQGLKIITKNFRTRRGEIDIIADDNGTLVFIEVRLRQHNALISAAASITPKKQQRWKTAATEYIQRHYPRPPDCRFDAILITQYPDGKETIEWLKAVTLK